LWDGFALIDYLDHIVAMLTLAGNAL
jgi:hypothetical protein